MRGAWQRREGARGNCGPIPIAIGPLPSGVKKPPKALSTRDPGWLRRSEKSLTQTARLMNTI